MFETPSSGREILLSAGDYVQPNLGHGLRIWWAFYWRTTLIAIILTLALNAGLRRLYESMNVPGSVIGPVMTYDIYFFNYAAALFVMYYILRKNFRHFRVGLLSNYGGEGAQPLRPTLRRVLRVWWTYSWRSLFYLAIAWIVVVYPMAWFLGIFNPGPVFVAVFSVVFGLFVSAAVGLFAIYSNILDEDIADFRVCLLPRQAASTVSVTSVSSPIV